MSRPFDAKVDACSTGAGFLTCGSVSLPKPSPQETRVTDGPCRRGESNSPLTVTRSCGICTHFPFPFMHPGRVLTSGEMLTNQGEQSQGVSLRLRWRLNSSRKQTSEQLGNLQETSD